MFAKLKSLKNKVVASEAILRNAQQDLEKDKNALKEAQKEALELLGFDTSVAATQASIPKKWRMAVTITEGRRVQKKIFAEGGQWLKYGKDIRGFEFMFYDGHYLQGSDEFKTYDEYTHYPEITPEQFLSGERTCSTN